MAAHIQQIKNAPQHSTEQGRFLPKRYELDPPVERLRRRWGPRVLHEDVGHINRILWHRLAETIRQAAERYREEYAYDL